MDQQQILLRRTWVALYGDAATLAHELDARGWEVSAVEDGQTGMFLGPSESGAAPHVVVSVSIHVGEFLVVAVDDLEATQRLDIAALATAARSMRSERAVTVPAPEIDIGDSAVDGVERALIQLGFSGVGPALPVLRLEGSGEPLELHGVGAELARLLAETAQAQGEGSTLIDFASLWLALINLDPERWFSHNLPLAADGMAALVREVGAEVAGRIERLASGWRDMSPGYQFTIVGTPMQASISVREQLRWVTLMRQALVRAGARRSTLQLDDLMGSYLLLEPGEHRREMQRWFGKPSDGDDPETRTRVGESRLNVLSESFIENVAARWPEELHFWKERFLRRFHSHARLMRLDIAPSAHIASDRWTTHDELGYRAYALAIAAFLKHPKSQPPLTISIQAPWGGGKTSVMRMLAAMLDRAAPALPVAQQTLGVLSPGLTLADVAREFGGGVPWWLPLGRRAAAETPLASAATGLPPSATRLHVVWFNAWKYQSLNQVWAGISKAILGDLTAKLPAAQRELFWLRLNLARVDTGQVRRRVHEQLLQLALRAARGSVGWLLGGLAALLTAWAASLLPVGGALPLLGSFGAGAFGLAALGLFATAAQKMVAALRKQLDTEPPKDLLDKLVREPDYDKEAGFVHHAAEDLQRVFALLQPDERLVVFIDDLDRCSPQHVAAVTEAINLFLAGDFPSCYFVIGMDTTLVAAALDVAHQAIGAKLNKSGGVSMGWRFMDKFVQLPLVLPRPQAEVSRSYLGSLMPRAVGRTPAGDAAKAGQGAALPVDAAKSVAAPSEGRQRRVSTLRGVESSGRALPEEIDALAREGQRRFRDEDPEFVDSLARLLDLFGGNPRDTKRLVNTFRFQCYVSLARKRAGLAVPPLHLLARWVAIGLCWPEFVSWYRHQDDAALGEARLRAAGMRNADEFASLTLLPLLEVLALSVEQGAIDGWGPWLARLWGVDDSQAWVRDRRLTALLAQDKRDDSERLSSAIGTGFW